MHNLIFVEGHKSLRRDSQTLGIINTDTEALELAKKRRNKAKETETAIAELRSDMIEIKNLLKDLLRNTKHG